ncbi:glucosaminidase domain-containing protein, partial [Clostridium tarantellae]
MKKKYRLISKFILYVYLSVIFLNNLLLVNVQARPITKIVGQASVSLQKAKEWAKNNGATDEFIGLANIYWDLAPKHGGIDPAVAYAQSAYETGYGRFGGVIDATYHNPCGMKTEQGGADNDKNAHQRFDSWEDGISAHLDHIALYVGAKGYPKPKDQTKDPRHFNYLYGKSGDSVEKLGETWATTKVYGKKLASLVRQLQGKYLPSKIHINTNITELIKGNNQLIQGWALNDSAVEKVNIYIDNNFIGQANYGEDSPFVAQDYPEYSNSNKAGYTLRFDASKLSLGNHEIKVEIIGDDGIKYKKSVPVKVVEGKLPKTHINTNLKELKQEGNQVIQGWAINKSGVEAVNVYIDNKFIGKANYGEDSPFV